MSDELSPSAEAAVPLGAGGARRRADSIAAIALLIVHIVVYGATFLWIGLGVMITDSCAYQKCGDEVWLTRAIHLNGWGGAALLAADFGVTGWRLVNNRCAWFVPVLGCLAQIVLALGCAALEAKAGPLH